jgi:calcineurin-like phosphoesterase family protein
MSNRKSIHFTSDWHLGHANSLKFDNRPFKDIDHMHRVLINNYNAQVPIGGVCYFLGDMGMVGTEAMAEIMGQLNGTKVLVLGNHDKNHSAMYNAGFDVVLNAAVLYIAGERVTLSHCPLRGLFREDVTGMKNAMDEDKWHGEHKNQAFSVENEGQFHLHGHIHAGPANDKLVKDGRQWDIGAPGNKYRPVHISEVESWIAKTKLDNL